MSWIEVSAMLFQQVKKGRTSNRFIAGISSNLGPDLEGPEEFV